MPSAAEVDAVTAAALARPEVRDAVTAYTDQRERIGVRDHVRARVGPVLADTASSVGGFLRAHLGEIVHRVTGQVDEDVAPPPVQLSTPGKTSCGPVDALVAQATARHRERLDMITRFYPDGEG